MTTSTTAIHRMVETCRAGTNPYVITRMTSGWAVMGQKQMLRGYSLLLPDPVVPHLNALPRVARDQFLSDLGVLGEAVLAATGGLCARDNNKPFANGVDLCGATTSIGAIQTVNTFRFNDLSINYVVPTGLAHVFRAQTMSVALQGSNLALHTNYRGKDPNVNAFSTVSSGDETIDLGGLPQPRTWWLKLSLGN